MRARSSKAAPHLLHRNPDDDDSAPPPFVAPRQQRRGDGTDAGIIMRGAKTTRRLSRSSGKVAAVCSCVVASTIAAMALPAAFVFFHRRLGHLSGNDYYLIPTTMSASVDFGPGGGGGSHGGDRSLRTEDVATSASEVEGQSSESTAVAHLTNRAPETTEGTAGSGHVIEEDSGEGLGRRFPAYGTPAYSKRCGWLLDATERNPPPSPRDASGPAGSGCTFYYGPSKDARRESEGVSFWTTQIVSSHLLAAQAGCRLLFDYGPGVELDEVLIPPPGSPYNWTVPRGYDCDDDPKCHRIERHRKGKAIGYDLPDDGNAERTSLVPVPRYRYAYSHSLDSFSESDNFTIALERAFPGFDIRDGMSCSLRALFELNPDADRYEPELFRRLLPTLTPARGRADGDADGDAKDDDDRDDDDALVIGVYIRTGWTDMSSRKKMRVGVERGVLSDDGSATDATAQSMIDYAARVTGNALSLERNLLLARRRRNGKPAAAAAAAGGDFASPKTPPKRAVWMVSTDSPHIKEWIHDKYDNGTAPTGIPRTVLTTSSKGKHTRISEGPSTSDFAEALLDWWLLGESDAVMTDRMSFAETAALRTSAPLYSGARFVPLLKEQAGRTK